MEPSIAALNVSPSIADAWLAELSAPHRFYHNERHIRAIVANYDRLFGGGNPIIYATAWLHDIRYDAQRADNEEQSAAVAERDLDGTGIDIPAVTALILDTKLHRGGTPLSNIFNDLDLAILSEPWEVYLEYARGIRNEYRFAPLEQYAERRAAVMQGFNRHQLYRTTAFMAREARGHDNLQREIDLLLSNPAMID
jgi:predicted metal-dependent HD superfamily phosphohydrolase